MGVGPVRGDIPCRSLRCECSGSAGAGATAPKRPLSMKASGGAAEGLLGGPPVRHVLACDLARSTIEALSPPTLPVPDARSPGRGYVKDDVPGTSFAAPIVSGALAPMMEHFRGTRCNTAIVRRILDTADRSGVYSQSEIYGAGHLDLEAAHSPVGTLTEPGIAPPMAAEENSVAFGPPLNEVTKGVFGARPQRTVTDFPDRDSRRSPSWTGPDRGDAGRRHGGAHEDRDACR